MVDRYFMGAGLAFERGGSALGERPGSDHRGRLRGFDFCRVICVLERVLPTKLALAELWVVRGMQVEPERPACLAQPGTYILTV